MKKILFILAFSVGLVACESEVKFNDPAVQAEKNYATWKATDFKAEYNEGALVITAEDGIETLTMRTPAYEFWGRYDLGVSNSTRVKLVRINEDETQSVYETNATKGSGYIEFAPADQQVPGTITGTFLINLPTELDGVINYQKGVFYRVPLAQAK